MSWPMCSVMNGYAAGEAELTPSAAALTEDQLAVSMSAPTEDHPGGDMKASRVALTTLGILVAFTGPVLAESGPTQDELNHADRSTEWLLPNHDYAGCGS